MDAHESIELTCCELDNNAEVSESSGCTLNSELSLSGARQVHLQYVFSGSIGHSHRMLISSASTPPL